MRAHSQRPPQKSRFPSRLARGFAAALLLAAIGPLTLPARAADGDGGGVNYIWLEGEDAVSSDAYLSPEERDSPEQPWYTHYKRSAVSGGGLLAHHSLERSATAVYEFTVPEAGEFDFWLRGNPLRSTVDYRFTGLGGEEAEWISLPTSPCLEWMNIAIDETPDMRFLGWFKGGRHALASGSHRLEVQLGRGDENIAWHGYIDCILLTPDPFDPNGPAKPGGRLDLARPGTWAFSSPKDHFTPDALFDFRSMLCDEAGANGWIRHDENGDFVRGDGSLIRFWAAGTGGHHRTVEELDEHARFLAKRGVNMVRFHEQLGPGSQEDFGSVNETTLDHILKGVATFKKHGIYTTVSPFWAVAGVRPGGQYQPFGRESGDMLGLLFWDPEMQGYYKSWLRELFTRPNPYCPDNKALKDDPALAIFQIQNEDSLLFWTQWGVMNGRRAEFAAMNALFLAWLDENGLELEIDQEFNDWLRQSDFPEDTKLDIRFWMTGDQATTPPAAFQLSMRWLTEVMRNFNAEIARYVREDLGAPVLINAGNWTTANQLKLLDLERYSYDVNDVIAVNRYIDGGHHPADPANNRTGWLVATGDRYTSISCVREGWRSLSINVKQPMGKPFIVPESSWVPPSLWRAEGPFLISAYSSLTGVDAFYWFNLGNVRYDPFIAKWQVATPDVMGGWPAAALMFHKGYVRRGDPAVIERRALEGDMWELRCPVISEDSSYDPNRPGTVIAQTNVEGGAPFGAFLVGPVLVEYDADLPGALIDLHGQDEEDLNRGVIRSNTGELFMNAPEGYCLLDAPAAQGVTGFLRDAGGEFRTSALHIRSGNEYAAILAVSMDGEPLRAAGRILLQVTTTCRPYGFEEEPAAMAEGDGATQGFRILNTGSIPWNVVNTDVSVTIENTAISRATLCDENFYAAGDIEVVREGDRVSLILPPNAMYVVLE